MQTALLRREISMTGNQIIRAYYAAAAYILRKHMPYIPKLKLTNAKKYYGQIWHTETGYRVDLSSWNLAVNSNLIDRDDIGEIIDTICHEFAHMTHWEHGKDHDELTAAYQRYVQAELEVRLLERQLAKTA
jgi:hypothetical protein